MTILPTAQRVGRWMAYSGLVCGMLYAGLGLVYDLTTTGLNWGTAMAFGALIGMPLLFGVFGFLCAALVVLIISGASAAIHATARMRGARH